MEDERFYTVEDIVRILQVHEETVRRWLREGELKGFSLGRKSGYRVRPTDLEAFIRQREEASRRD